MSQPTTWPYVLTFQEGVSLVERDGAASIEANGRAVSLRRATPAVLGALRALAAAGATRDEMAAAVGDSEPPDALAVLFFHLERFEALGLLSFSVRAAGGALLATLSWTPAEASARAAVLPGAPDPERRYVLSRFAVIRSHGGSLVLESPLGRGRVTLRDARALAVCHALAEPRSVAELSDLCAEAPLLLGLLLGCRAASVDGPGGEAADGALAMWSHHDLLFHTRSRWGRTPDRVGATFRFAGKTPPLPAARPRSDRPRTALFQPDIDALMASDVSFSRVLEERKSIRAHGEAPIHVKQLGELLYRAARVRSLGTSTWGPPYETSNRPYPGGGACYELELYLAVSACEGLAPGLYRHDPHEHALETLSGPTPAVEGLLSGARAAMLASAPPQVLLVVTARFGRVMWKYESMAYATILKDVGVLYQTIYLVATAMGLAPSALGSGDSDLFARAAGLDYLEETSVGEMALGSRAT